MNDSPHFRKDGRRSLSLKVQIRQGHATDANQYEAELLDLGMGGAFVHTDKAAMVGAKLTLRVSAPTSWNPIDLSAEVRWLSEGHPSRPPGFGVHFLPMDSSEAAALYDLIQAIGYDDSK